MTFLDCLECGGACCRGFGVPCEYAFEMYTVGIPIAMFRGNLDQNPRRYFELHEGVIVVTDNTERIVIDTSIPVKELRDWNGVKYLYIESRCTMLTPEGRCKIYEDRPVMCRAFTAETAEYYSVPAGCIYEPTNKEAK